MSLAAIALDGDLLRKMEAISSLSFASALAL
jgi:hypothetical protein